MISSSSKRMDPQVWGSKADREKAIDTLIRYINKHCSRVLCGYTYNSATGFGLTKVWKLCTDSIGATDSDCCVSTATLQKQKRANHK